MVITGAAKLRNFINWSGLKGVLGTPHTQPKANLWYGCLSLLGLVWVQGCGAWVGALWDWLLSAYAGVPLGLRDWSLSLSFSCEGWRNGRARGAWPTPVAFMIPILYAAGSYYRGAWWGGSSDGSGKHGRVDRLLLIGHPGCCNNTSRGSPGSVAGGMANADSGIRWDKGPSQGRWNGTLAVRQWC